MKAKCWSRAPTVDPSPGAGHDAGVLLGADPHELRLEVLLAALQLGQQEEVPRAGQAVHQVAAVGAAGRARRLEGAARLDGQLEADAVERRQLRVRGATRRCAPVVGELWKGKEEDRLLLGELVGVSGQAETANDHL